MIIDETMLDAFVRGSDRRGGPGTPACDSFWHGSSYKPTTVVPDGLDPFGGEYMAAQLALYQEISGRTLDQDVNEMTSFDLPLHSAAPNPYGTCRPADIALHVQRLSRAIMAARPPWGGHMLDMGCGWGLSSEVAAYLGLHVTGVDINPRFVELVNQRSAARSLSVKAVRGTFDGYVPDRPSDLILFYECLHHALRPWDVVSRLAGSLAPGGAIVLAGEPINDIWWPHWGMRLDMVSVYCVRKYGWLESGWSLGFITSVLARAGLQVEVEFDAGLGHTVVARKAAGAQAASPDGNLDAARDAAPGDVPDAAPDAAPSAALGAAAQWCGAAGWIVERENLVLCGTGTLRLPFPDGTGTATLSLYNHRPAPVRLQVTCEGRAVFDGEVPSGASSVAIKRQGNPTPCTLQGEVWVPDDEIENGDLRRISLHVVGVNFA